MPPHVYIDECFEQLLEPPPPWWLRVWIELVYWPDRLKVVVLYSGPDSRHTLPAAELVRSVLG